MIKIKIAGIVNDSITDGPGLRLAVFAQGCPHKCDGCHNPHTHPFDGGTEISVDDILVSAKSNPLLDGITLSGGEPFMQAEAFAILAEGAKKLGLTVIAYTGFTWEELISNDASFMPLIKMCDYIIDGRYIKDQRSIDLLFKGSQNQRIIDVSRTLDSKAVTTAEFS